MHHQRNQITLEKWNPVLVQGKDKMNVEYLAVPGSIKVLKK